MEVTHFPIARDYLPKHCCSFSFCLVPSFLLQDSSVEELCRVELNTTKAAHLTSVLRKKISLSSFSSQTITATNGNVLMLRHKDLECEVM